LVTRTRPTFAWALLLACSAMLSAQVARAQGADRVGFRAELSADTIYVGEQLTYSLSVRIPTDVRQRLRRNPEFVPPDPRAMLAYDLPLARVADPAAALEVHTFRRALFVLTPGRYQIAAARLSYALPQSTSFFSREEERTLRSEAVSFVALEPPLRGRPATWLGGVGRWNATARAEPAMETRRSCRGPISRVPGPTSSRRTNAWSWTPPRRCWVA
jgi:hypothetical protein